MICQNLKGQLHLNHHQNRLQDHQIDRGQTEAGIRLNGLHHLRRQDLLEETKKGANQYP